MRVSPRAGAKIGIAGAVAFAAIIAGAALTFTAASFAPAAAQTAGTPMTTPSGLKIIDTKIGTGPSPKPGQICVMHYTGWLYEHGAKLQKFD